MSTWTNERHEDVRRRLGATDGALHCGWDDGLDEPMQEVVANAHADLADALDEIERLRALTTITDDMVARAEEALVYTMGQESYGADWISEWEGWTVVDGTYDMPSAVRAALDAALGTGEGS